MSLHLDPEVENQVRERAEAAGTTASDYVARPLVATATQPRRLAPRLRVLSAEKAIRGNAASIALLQSQLADAERATPEEIAVADREWQAFEQAVNENRRSAGERIVYKEADSR